MKIFDRVPVEQFVARHGAEAEPFKNVEEKIRAAAIGETYEHNGSIRECVLQPLVGMRGLDLVKRFNLPTMLGIFEIGVQVGRKKFLTGHLGLNHAADIERSFCVDTAASSLSAKHLSRVIRAATLRDMAKNSCPAIACGEEAE
jgi:hypothetical protein